MKNRDLLQHLNLQFFAEGEGGGSEGGNATGTDGTGATDGEGKGADGEGVSFDDFLKDKKNQAEFDRRVAKALETQKGKLDSEYQKGILAAKKEAEKLAKMNEDQKKQYEAEKKDQLIEDQKKEIAQLKMAATRAELSKQAARIMKEDHDIVATQDMLDFVVGDDSDVTSKNINKLVGIIMDDRKQVEKERSKGKTPQSYKNCGKTLSEIEKCIAKYK